jgi:hypothetical protein
MQNIPTTHILHVTCTMLYIYFNTSTQIHFIIPLCGVKIKITNSYRGADKSLALPTSQCILFDGENISFDASLVIHTHTHTHTYIYISAPHNLITKDPSLFHFFQFYIALSVPDDDGDRHYQPKHVAVDVIN